MQVLCTDNKPAVLLLLLLFLLLQLRKASHPAKGLQLLQPANNSRGPEPAMPQAMLAAAHKQQLACGTGAAVLSSQSSSSMQGTVPPTAMQWQQQQVQPAAALVAGSMPMAGLLPMQQQQQQMALSASMLQGSLPMAGFLPLQQQQLLALPQAMQQPSIMQLQQQRLQQQQQRLQQQQQQQLGPMVQVFSQPAAIQLPLMARQGTAGVASSGQVMALLPQQQALSGLSSVSPTAPNSACTSDASLQLLQASFQQQQQQQLAAASVGCFGASASAAQQLPMSSFVSDVGSLLLAGQAQGGMWQRAGDQSMGMPTTTFF
jgi:hypothetical protein